jgi:predicted nucleotidyltransferase
MSTKQFTPHQEVNSVLTILLKNVKETLREQFVGMYLYGSLASGDFDPTSSDIDFVVITKDILSDELISKLEALHEHIWSGGSKWALKLEGSYVSKSLIRRHNLDGHPCPTVNEGKFFVDRRGSDWIIQRHVIREYGVVLEGPDPKSLIDLVTPDEIRQSVLGVLSEWWFPMLDHPNWLSDRGCEYHAYAVITMCRSLHALQHGTIVSKPIAANWAQVEFGEWSSLIQKALISQHEKHAGFLDEALDFIRFTRSNVLQAK